MNLYKTFRREGQLFQPVPQDQFVPACGYKSDRQCAFLPVFVGDVLIHDPMDCTDIPISCQPQDCGGVCAVAGCR